MDKKVESWQLKQRQSLPLEAKIVMSQERIRAWHEHYDGRVFISFSGGLDSTVLLHLVRQIYPEVPAAFVHDLPFPEIVDFVKQTEKVTTFRPKMPFNKVVEHYGYPVISKRIAQYVREVQRARGETATKRLRLTGIRSDGSHSPMAMISKKWQYLCDAPFRVDDRCCNALKKKPLKEAEKMFGSPFVGVRADESSQRTQTYYLYGCNAFNLRRPRSWPLSHWTHNDVWEYIREFSVPYSKIYDMGYESTGCFACMFGAHMEKEPNRFQRMRTTHPNLWKYCESIGIPEVLDYIGVPYNG